MENFWQTCSAQLELELTPQQYTAWIKPLVALDYEDGKLRIAAPNRFKLDWVKTQFANRITALASSTGSAGRGAVRARPEKPCRRKPPRARRRPPTATAAGSTAARWASMPPPTTPCRPAPVITPDNVIANNPRREQSRVNPN
jgi:chromosomal replication initiator protein